MVPQGLSPHIQEMLATRERFQFAMPPVGISVTRFQLGGVTYETHTARCDVKGCWMVYYQPEKTQAERFLADHKLGVQYPSGERGWPSCPSWPMRELLPSGLSNLQKLWNELDDVVDALAEGGSYRDMTGDILKGYAQGIAFNIVMLDGGVFKNQTQVSKQAGERRKMRRGEMEYAETPTRYSSSYTVLSGGEYKVSDLPGKKVIAGAKVTTPASKKSAPAAPKLDAVKAAVIKSALDSGMFTAQDLAEMYNIPVDLVKQVGA